MEESFSSSLSVRFNYQDGLKELNTILDSIPEGHGTYGCLFNLTKLNGKFYILKKTENYRLKELGDKEKGVLILDILSRKFFIGDLDYRVYPLFTSKVEDGKIYCDRFVIVKAIFKDDVIYFEEPTTHTNKNIFTRREFDPYDEKEIKEKETKRILTNIKNELEKLIKIQN